jgi:hypothetical protein
VSYPGAAPSVETATLADGRTLKFVPSNDPPAGGMKNTYFAPDRSYVVQFYKEPNRDPERLARLQSILGKLNPTIEPNSSKKAAEYWRRLFCWPTGVVTKPQLGLVAPIYPSNFFFATGPFKGTEKNGKFFSSAKLRKHLPPVEQGDWINYFQICILIARAVRRLHVAGLAHSDLSANNILVDPSGGAGQSKSIVIDIDSLVVPGKLAPDVIGTPGYIAPEVLGTQALNIKDPRRQHPNIRTDQHALAVLMYEYLLFRHPLRGNKVHNTADVDQDELLSMGPRALFVEHPTDHSNRQDGVKVPYTALGPHLADLFKRAFIDGLHDPKSRPTAMDWERALVRTWDLLFPCVNRHCSHKWMILHDPKNVRCPFCGAASNGSIPVLLLMKEGPIGNWKQDARLLVYPEIHLFKWHAYDGIFPSEETDREPVAKCIYFDNRWVLVNQALTSLTSPAGARVPIGQAVELKHGAQIRLSQEPHGRLAEVQMITL